MLEKSTPATGAGQIPPARGRSSSAGSTGGQGQRDERCWNICSWMLCPSFKPPLVRENSPRGVFPLGTGAENGAQGEMCVLQQLLGRS